MSDPYDLQRFVDAQESKYQSALDELRAGWKRGHWMWYMFPQVRGLGMSSMSVRYAIGSRAEAAAYWEHPVLGPRLREMTQTVLDTGLSNAHDIFGSPDHLKFRSCMTLFATCVPDASVFTDALGRFFAGEPDSRTLSILEESESGQGP